VADATSTADATMQGASLPDIALPDNTILSFERAISAGAEYLEIDVHGTRDGIAVVSHDPDLVRLTGRRESIAELSFAELAAIELGRQQRFSSLGEILARFPTTRLNIDIKAPLAVAGTVLAVHNARAHERVLITSFSERRRRAVVRQLPGVATSASYIRVALALVAANLRLSGGVRLALRGIHAVQIPLRAGRIPLLTPRLVEAIHRAGAEVHIWTINDRATMERLLDLGIDGLVTDRADVAVQLLEERSLSHP
jgi:glycerophosphoryl diester phosphodiesterase